MAVTAEGRVRVTVILSTGWALFLLYGFPGVLTLDSFGQLHEGRIWEFTDAHPPAMAAMWGVVDRLLAGPFGMLVIQSGTFLLGVYLLLCRAMRPLRAAIVACAILLFPPVIAPFAVIWKDCVMAGFLVLGTAALLEERRWIRVLGLACFIVATAIRYNAPAATLPLIGALMVWTQREYRSVWRRIVVRYGLAFVTWVGVTAAAFGMNAALVDHEMHFWHSSLAVTDIAGTLAKMEEDLPDPELREILGPTGIRANTEIHDAVRAQWRAHDFMQLLIGDRRLWDLPLSGTTPAPEPVREAIENAWLEIVGENLDDYFEYRMHTFRRATGWTRHPVISMVIKREQQYPSLLAAMKIPKGSSDLQLAWERFNHRIALETPLFRPRPYLVLSVLLLLVACYWRQRDAGAIFTSGILYQLGMFPVVLTPDYRYSHWMIVCTCVGLVMLFARRVAQERAHGTR